MMTFVLGAPDPEMAEIERLLRAHGASTRIVHAAHDGKRVHPGNAYAATGTDRRILGEAITVECSVYGVTPATLVDHHRPGDPGYGRPPGAFWEASSLGQVCTLIGVVPELRVEHIRSA